MAKLNDTSIKTETTILVGLITQKQTEEQLEEYLNELAFLCETAGSVPQKRFTQKLTMPDSRTYVGSGKLEEIKEYIAAGEIDIAVFDDELSPSQLRNIENILECKVLDRNSLILHIFATRARTSYSKTQVELAQYQYLLPRLTQI